MPLSTLFRPGDRVGYWSSIGGITEGTVLGMKDKGVAALVALLSKKGIDTPLVICEWGGCSFGWMPEGGVILIKRASVSSVGKGVLYRVVSGVGSYTCRVSDPSKPKQVVLEYVGPADSVSIIDKGSMLVVIDSKGRETVCMRLD